MIEKVVLVLSCGTDNPNRSTRGLHLATVAHKKGKDVKVFLLDEAVNLVKKGMINHLQAATGDIADDLLTYGARMATAMELIDICCDDASVISL